MRNWILTFGGLFFLWACTGTDTGNSQFSGGYIEETETVVSGILTDSNGAPASNCSLSIRSLQTSFAKSSILTNVQGVFRVENIPAGDYVLMAKSLTRNQGLQIKFSLGKGDSLIWEAPLEMKVLTELILPVIPFADADSIRVVELGQTFARPMQDTVLIQIPIGSYTLVPVGSSAESIETETVIPPISFQASTFLWTEEAGTLSDGRDGQSYEVIQNGEIFWLAENLRYQNIDEYSYSQARSACPIGWHLPSVADWELSASTSLLTTFDSNTRFWTIDTQSSSQAWAVYRDSSDQKILLESTERSQNLKVRCIKD